LGFSISALFALNNFYDRKFLVVYFFYRKFSGLKIFKRDFFAIKIFYERFFPGVNFFAENYNFPITASWHPPLADKGQLEDIFDIFSSLPLQLEDIFDIFSSPLLWSSERQTPLPDRIEVPPQTPAGGRPSSYRLSPHVYPLGFVFTRRSLKRKGKGSNTITFMFR